MLSLLGCVTLIPTAGSGGATAGSCQSRRRQERPSVDPSATWLLFFRCSCRHCYSCCHCSSSSCCDAGAHAGTGPALLLFLQCRHSGLFLTTLTVAIAVATRLVLYRHCCYCRRYCSCYQLMLLSRLVHMQALLCSLKFRHSGRVFVPPLRTATAALTTFKYHRHCSLLLPPLLLRGSAIHLVLRSRPAGGV